MSLLHLFSLILPFSVSAAPVDVYLLAHTHLDVGWLQTFDSYYYLNVSYMLPGIIDNLVRDPTKRFAWAEITYFQQWWAQDATSTQKSQLRTLVNNKQFEFVDGGLVQHDQAIPTSYDIVSHMTEGINFIINNFGAAARPRIGWSLDPFGSSASNAVLYGLMGYDALVINRIPDAEMNNLKATQSLEFVWYGSASVNKTDSSIFTHVLDSYFCPPGGFRWSWSQADDPPITPANVVDKANSFGSQVLPRAAWFRTNQIFIPYGCDFMYYNASVVYGYTDLFMAEVNANPTKYGYTVHYATPTEFFNIVHSNTSVTWPVRNNVDFLPLVYGSGSSAETWSGYFTSRPSLKKSNRVALGAIQSADILYTLASKIAPSTETAFHSAADEDLCLMDSRTHTRQSPTQQRSPHSKQRCNSLSNSFNLATDLDLLSDAKVFHSIALHHDAITGTMCEGTEGCTGGGQGSGDHNVLEDYLRYQAESIVKSETVLTDALAILLAKNGTSTLPAVFTVTPNRDYGGGIFSYNSLLNKEFSVALMKRKTVALMVHNPLAWTRTEAISLQVPLHGIQVTDSTGAVIPSQTLTGAFTYDGRYASGFPELFDQTLTFLAAKIPPLGYVTYFLTACQVTSAWPYPCVNSPSLEETLENTKEETATTRISASGPQQFTLNNNYFILYADNVTGPIAYYDKVSGRNFSFGITLRSYQSKSRSSDNAYVWAPSGSSQPLATGIGGTLNGAVLQQNSLMDQIYFRVTLQHGFYVRVYHTGVSDIDTHLEVQADLGLIDDMSNIVMEYSTDLGPNHFYTDGNSFEYYERIQNQSKTLPENSWPQQSSILMRDTAGKYEFSVLTELGHMTIVEAPQSQSKVQLNLLRRAGEGGDPEFDDKADISQRMYVVLGATSSATRIRRSLLPRKQFPLRFGGSITTSVKDFTTQYQTTLSPISMDLPLNIHLFSLAPLHNDTDNSNSIILRLQHLYQSQEDSTYSTPVSINLSQLFSTPPYIISSCVEKTLSFAINKGDLTRWVWNTGSLNEAEKVITPPEDFSNDFIVTLNPLEIRTYQITWK